MEFSFQFDIPAMSARTPRKDIGFNSSEWKQVKIEDTSNFDVVGCDIHTTVLDAWSGIAGDVRLKDAEVLDGTAFWPT